MEIILLKDVAGLGSRFDKVTVKNGYGRNYLIPKKMAVIANRANSAKLAERMRQIQAKEERILAEIEQLIERIKANPIQVGAKVGTTDKIFGSVTNVQLAEAIKKQTGVELDRRKLSINEEVKTLGTYKATISFREGAVYEFDFDVVSE